MKLNAPKRGVWYLSLVLGVLGLLGKFVSVPVLSPISFWLVFVGFVLLLLATAMKNL